MSPKLKKALIIGGIALGSLAVIAIVVVGILWSSISRSSGQAYLSMPEEAAGYDMGAAADYDYAEDEAVFAEAPAAEPMPEMMDDARATNGSTDIGQDFGQQIERLIIRNGNISMSVNDTRDTKASIEQIVAGLAAQGAFVVSSNEYGGSEEQPYISMTIRVPSDQFDIIMDQLEGMAVEGTSPSTNEYAQDVTEEYVDIQARVESLEAARDRLLTLMQGAETTEDLLMAEQQLTVREAEIESLKGRMRYLAESARLSRIDIELQPYILSQPIDTRWRPAETVRESFEALLNGLRNFGEFLIYFAIAVLPWLLVFALVVYGIVRFIIWRVRVGQRKRAAREATE